MRLEVGTPEWRALRTPDKKVGVFLNGEEQSDVIMADEEAGELRRFVRGKDGRLQRDPSDPEVLMTEVVRGTVKIVVEE